MTPIKIGQRTIGPESPPFIIAELSGNHSQDFDLACKMIDAASASGAHAIKLQTYTADSMTLNVDAPDFVINDKKSLWDGARLYELYQQASTPYDWHKPLFDRAKSLGMLAFSSPFDTSAVDFLASLEVPCYKIASFELTDLPLISYTAKQGKPIIMSTGMASLAEIEDAVTCARDNGCHEIILLKCTSTYPASPQDTNLLTIPNMKATFGCQVGLSDHTKGIGVAVASVGLGASIIEKHFVLDRTAGGVDAAFSLEPEELSGLVTETQRAWEAMGGVHYSGTQNESPSRQFRRSIYVSKDIAAGEMLTQENIKIVRPAFGLAPKHWEQVVSKTAATDLKQGTALQWEHIKS